MKNWKCPTCGCLINDNGDPTPSTTEPAGGAQPGEQVLVRGMVNTRYANGDLLVVIQQKPQDDSCCVLVSQDTIAAAPQEQKGTRDDVAKRIHEILTLKPAVSIEWLRWLELRLLEFIIPLLVDQSAASLSEALKRIASIDPTKLASGPASLELWAAGLKDAVRIAKNALLRTQGQPAETKE